MPNGELRFRLMHLNGGGYIRTVAVEGSGWQVAHYHEQVAEVYVVEAGWMGFVERVGAQLKARVLRPGEVVSSAPGISHNVYLPDAAVIHTVKLPGMLENDWQEDPELSVETSAWTEEVLFGEASLSDGGLKVDPEHLIKPVMDHYINLDRLLWSVPAFLFAASTVTVGLVSSKAIGEGDVSFPVGALSFGFLIASLFCGLGWYAIDRISYHHKLIGIEIYGLTGLDYFGRRSESLEKSPRRSAHYWLKSAMAALGMLFLTAATLETFFPTATNQFLFGKVQSLKGAPSGETEQVSANTLAPGNMESVAVKVPAVAEPANRVPASVEHQETDDEGRASAPR